MADTAKRIVGPLSLATTSAVLYTVPVSTTTIVRNIHVANSTSSLVTFNLMLNGAATSASVALYYQYTVPPFGAVDWSGFMVMNATDTLQGLAGTNTSLSIVVSGIEAT